MGKMTSTNITEKKLKSQHNDNGEISETDARKTGGGPARVDGRSRLCGFEAVMYLLCEKGFPSIVNRALGETQTRILAGQAGRHVRLEHATGVCSHGGV
ncbi:hypothetical protein L2E82_12061 [Cichorium intybus]|uniref:Uncharacterized protein n=1 Tax=Cichorium intybus TaxID=13427 RepID=A0ACB9GF09_CICIN|nr:hypothetical protein L2E82_12061 [Cichorium intybus]